jgi:hypothetical protein
MHFSTILFGFAAMASAIDVKMFDNANCGGGAIVWRNINPNVCCAWNNDHHNSAEWSAIPTNWQLNVGAYRNGNCGALVTSRDVNDQASVCLTGESSVDICSFPLSSEHSP